MKDITIKSIKPMFTHILTTKDEYTEAAMIAGTGIIDATKLKQGVKEYQKVVAIGSGVHNVKVGDLVAINPKRYAVMKYKKTDTKEMMEEYHNMPVRYAFPSVEVNGQELLYLDEADVDFVIDEYEEID